MRLIDADVLRERFTDNNRMVSKADVRSAIKKAETIPAVIPVRCHECVHDMNCGAQPFIGYSGMCYCSSGERKEGQ